MKLLLLNWIQLKLSVWWSVSLSSAPLPTLWTHLLCWLYHQDRQQWPKRPCCQGLRRLPHHPSQRRYALLQHRAPSHPRLMLFPPPPPPPSPDQSHPTLAQRSPPPTTTTTTTTPAHTHSTLFQFQPPSPCLTDCIFSPPYPHSPTQRLLVREHESCCSWESPPPLPTL